MSDEIKVTGQVDLVQIAATLNHVVLEMGRLGEVLAEESRENRRRFDDVKAEIVQCRADMLREINDISKDQIITSKDVKHLSGKIAVLVSAATMLLGWLLKSGIAAVLL